MKLAQAGPALRGSERAVGPAIRVQQLRKVFGEVTAVDGVSFEVAAGEIFAFLGPNGAGKSSTIHVLCTLARPTSGSVEVAGFDAVTHPDEVRRRIGLVFQEPTLDVQLTAAENLRFHAVLYGMPRRTRESRIDRVLDLVALRDRRHDLVSTFSGGMARRLEIARAMLHTPAVMFLDEPTAGLDPQTRARMWDDILMMRRTDNVTVFLTTHYMEEAEVADRIGIIDRGRLVALGTPSDLKAAVGSDSLGLRTTDDSRALVRVQDAGYRAEAGPDGITVFIDDAEGAVGPIVELIGGGVRSVHVRRPTLDDVFLHFTGRAIRQQGGDLQSGMARAWHGRR
jgi:ABC-2 type transport system ATP-binding protein